MTCMLRALITALCLSLPAAAFGQGSVLQSGPKTPGHVPQYVGTGTQAIVQDGGGAGGGGAGANPSELGLTARGTGTPPYVGQGHGPLGTIDCRYDAPITNATGYHYLCFGPNPGQLVFGASSPAAPIPFTFNINGISYALPASGTAGNVVTTVVPTTSGAPVCFTGTSGQIAVCPSIAAATFTGNPTNGPISQPQNFTVPGLPARGAPDANNDKIVIHNNATGAFNYVTPGLIASSATAGVSSLGGVTGPITLGSNLQMTGSVLSGLPTPPGGSNGQIQYNNAGAFGGFTAGGDATIVPSTGVVTIQPNAVTTGKINNAAVTNAKLAPGAANTTKGSVDGTTTSDLAMASCSAAYQFTQWLTGTGWRCGLNPVLPSRAIAATLDLSAYLVVTTQGYATPGDGGGALLKKVGAVPFQDSYIAAAALAGGSGYGVNATYLGVRLTGGVGVGCKGRVTVTGGAVSAIDISGMFCAAYAVGDVLVPLPADMAGTGSGSTYTVTTVSTALASFIDFVTTRFQFVVDSGNVPNVRQFGAKLDWNGVDGSATNDLPSFKSGMAFASITFGSAAALINGNTLFVPKGAAYLCAGGAPFSTLIVGAGTNLRGAGIGAATLKQCAAEDSSTHFLTLCDPNVQFGLFGCKLEDLQLVSDGAANSGVAMVYSNSGQQFPLINNVYMNATARNCVSYEIGKGGAANAIFDNWDCEQADSSTNKGFIGNSSGTQIVIRNSNFGCAPGNCAAGNYAINMVSGNFIVETTHIEQHQDAINVATTSASALSVIKNATINNGCVNGITLTASNPNKTVLVENIQSSCSTATVLNGHATGVNVTGHILPQTYFNPNATSF